MTFDGYKTLSDLRQDYSNHYNLEFPVLEVYQLPDGDWMAKCKDDFIIGTEIRIGSDDDFRNMAEYWQQTMEDDTTCVPPGIGILRIWHLTDPHLVKFCYPAKTPSDAARLLYMLYSYDCAVGTSSELFGNLQGLEIFNGFMWQEWRDTQGYEIGHYDEHYRKSSAEV